MASGFTTSGTDLDSVFAPYVSGWPQAGVTGFEVSGGADLNARYAPLSTGSAASATGFLTSGTDLNAIFAAAGSTSVVVGTQPGNVSGSAAVGNPSGTVTSNTTSCSGSKGKGSYTYTWHFFSGSGASFTNPSSPSTAITATVSAGTTLTGSFYCTISDGTTSVNTNVVTYSLQNTTAAFSGRTDTFTTPGTTSDTIPAGATTMVIEVWGPGAPGGNGVGSGTNYASGGGGASGAYCRSQFSVGSNNGQTVSISIPASGSLGTTTVSSGSFSMTTMSATSGNGGASAHGPTSPGAGGTAGAAGTGGNQVNSAGNPGGAGEVSGGNGVGATGVVGVNSTGSKGGDGGLDAANTGINVGIGPGKVVIQFSP